MKNLLPTGGAEERFGWRMVVLTTMQSYKTSKAFAINDVGMNVGTLFTLPINRAFASGRKTALEKHKPFFDDFRGVKIECRGGGLFLTLSNEKQPFFIPRKKRYRTSAAQSLSFRTAKGKLSACHLLAFAR